MKNNKLTIEQFGKPNGYKNKYSSQAQNLWVEICYNLYLLNIIDINHANCVNRVCDHAYYEYVDKYFKEKDGNLIKKR